MLKKKTFPLRTAWLFMAGAVLLEVVGTLVMKLSQNGGWLLSPGVGLVVMFVLVALSYLCLSQAVRGLPVGVAYAFWEGLGLTLITLVSVLVLGEKMNLVRFCALVAILVGAILVHHGTGSGGSRTARGE